MILQFAGLLSSLNNEQVLKQVFYNSFFNFIINQKEVHNNDQSIGIKEAADEATAGTTVLIRPGTYIEEDIKPKESGKADAMIVFRPENTSDIGKVIIKHKDVFNGSTITPQVKAQWLADTGWKEDEVKHYDNAGMGNSEVQY